MKLQSIEVTSIAPISVESGYYWGDVKIKIYGDQPDLTETVFLKVAIQCDPSESLQAAEDKVTNRVQEVLRGLNDLVP